MATIWSIKKQEPETVTDNEWHTIDIRFNRGSISFILDDGFNNYVRIFSLSVVNLYHNLIGPTTN